MKQFYNLRKTLALLFLAAATTATAQTTVTFSLADLLGGTTGPAAAPPVTKDGITLTPDKGTHSSSPAAGSTTATALRFYYKSGKANILTVTAESGKVITNITFTNGTATTDNKYPASGFGCNVGTYTNAEWSGAATSIVFTPKSDRVYIGSATVTYVEGGSFTVGAEKHITLFTDKAFTMPQGAKGGIVTAVESGKLTIEYPYTAGSIVPANTPLLIEADSAGTYTYTVAQTTETAPTNNKLQGSLNGETLSNASTLYYILSLDSNGSNLGFYWATADGHSLTAAAGKAYLPLTEAEAAGVKGFSFDNTTTGIATSLITLQEDTIIYDLSGRRVAKADKGIFIINGQKVIR